MSKFNSLVLFTNPYILTTALYSEQKYISYRVSHAVHDALVIIRCFRIKPGKMNALFQKVGLACMCVCVCTSTIYFMRMGNARTRGCQTIKPKFVIKRIKYVNVVQHQKRYVLRYIFICFRFIMSITNYCIIYYLFNVRVCINYNVCCCNIMPCAEMYNNQNRKKNAVCVTTHNMFILYIISPHTYQWCAVGMITNVFPQSWWLFCTANPFLYM